MKMGRRAGGGLALAMKAQHTVTTADVTDRMENARATRKDARWYPDADDCTARGGCRGQR